VGAKAFGSVIEALFGIPVNKMDENTREKIRVLMSDPKGEGVRGRVEYDNSGNPIGVREYGDPGDMDNDGDNEPGELIRVRADEGGTDGSDDDNDNDNVNPCPAGHTLVNGICVPDVIAGPTPRPTPTLPSPIRPIDGGGGGGPTIPRRSVPAVKVRGVQQFAGGGMVSSGLATAADNFLAALSGSA